MNIKSHGDRVEFETDTYLEAYFGMARDIIIRGPQVTVIFYAILNDDVSFEFYKVYDSQKAAMASLESYCQKTQKLEAGLPYNTEAIVRINQSIRLFLSDILNGKVVLPDVDYLFKGDKAYIRTLLGQKDNAFLWYNYPED